MLATGFRRVTSTPDPDTFEKYRDTPPICITILLQKYTILTEMMADEFYYLRPEIKNYKAEADADLIPIPGQLESHGRCRCGVLVSTCFCALFVAYLIVGVEE